jgi:mannose-6-phosphate isomerase-like protein (cupin superfamily)
MFRAKDEMKASVITDCHGGKGDLECRLVVGRDDAKGNLQFMHDDVLEPGAEIGEHVHEGDEEVYLIIEGKGTMIVDGREYPAGPGDATLCLSGHSHGIRNAGAAPMRLVVVGMKL